MKLAESVRHAFHIVLVLVFAILLTIERADSRELGEADVRSAVQSWVRFWTADAKPLAVIEKMEPYMVDGGVLAYIAHIQDGGFCLCGADDLSLPVYLYNPKDAFNDAIPYLRSTLSEIATSTLELRQAVTKRNARFLEVEALVEKRASLWKNLIAGGEPERLHPLDKAGVGPQILALPLTSRWSQGSPYNDQCPVLTPDSDEHCVVGCVPTAMAQILYYWKWPITGEGSNHWRDAYDFSTVWLSEPLNTDPDIQNPFWVDRLRWTSESGGALQMKGYWDRGLLWWAEEITNAPSYLTALNALYDRLTPASNWFFVDFSKETYNWEIMQDVHEDPPDAGDAEVAKLCFHIGMGCEVAWRLLGTDSSVQDGRDAFTNYFRYDSDIRYDAWGPSSEEMIIEELQWLRPVHTGGGNHSVVVHGYYKSTTLCQFLINYGWGEDPAWKTHDDALYMDVHNTLIAPRGVVRFVGNDVAGDGTPSSPYRNLEEAVIAAPDYSTLILKAWSTNKFVDASLVINRPLTLKGWQSVIVKEN